MSGRILTANVSAISGFSITQLLYGSSIVLTGLLAGLFYGYQCSVIAGLGRLGNREYLQAFQHINSAILNPLFFLSFIGSMVALIAATWLAYRNGNSALLPYLLTATVVYVVGVFGITAICNVPLNEMMASFNITSATNTEIDHMRHSFEASWNRWHLVRTIASVLVFVVLVLPLVRRL